MATGDARTRQTAEQGHVSHTSAYYSSPVAGDGRVILFSQLVDWTMLATADFAEEFYVTQAIVGGRIYLKTVVHLCCIW